MEINAEFKAFDVCYLNEDNFEGLIVCNGKFT